ncbi:MAG TPA: hypothetical protein VF909_22265, partial [Roseiflexaceae bacterium]
NDTWDANELTDLWFTGQLPQLTSIYCPQTGCLGGPNTRYHLMSINGHFNHHEAIPADIAGGTFTAARLLTPTLDPAQYPGYAYFMMPNSASSASLIYSVGCHSGLSAFNADIDGRKPQYQADFANAVLKQGGNLIGNTGFGYGDSDLVGYSERLALLFTNEIGRNIQGGGASPYYIGAPIGDSLARAKRAYVQASAPGSFSVYDEKVIEEMTLYGVPFIRVQVPNPSAPTYGGFFDPQPKPIPAGTPVNSNGVFTRIVTFTNTFDQPLADHVPQAYSTVEDSFLPGVTTLISSQDQMAIGRPVLPALTYDITLLPSAAGGPTPEPNGVRLRDATALPDLEGFNPHVTTPVTDQVYAQQQEDPAIEVQDAWQPEQPYSQQRTKYLSATEVLTRDNLIVNPAQFRAVESETGQLRRFSQMVFEISYIDPAVAPPSTLADEIPPLIGDVHVSLPGTALRGANPAGLVVHISASVSDNSTNPSSLNVTATYSTDKLNWDQIALHSVGGGLFEATVNAPANGQNIFVIVEARDKAGNVATDTAKGTLSSYTFIYLPLVRR